MAAVDLGSNSFHMVLARLHHGQLTIVDRLREMVRIASGLDKRSRLDYVTQERALDCLRRFGERLRDMQAHQVRVVGTNTFRKARRSKNFMKAAEEALGHPVDVISGIEEARLVYLGVSHHVAQVDGPILVIDIGGGSTELIIGEGHEPKRLESLFMGCVELSSRFFDHGKFTRRRFARARLAARLELRPVAAQFHRTGWQMAVGSSGTIRAAARVARNLGFLEAGITVEALEAIIEEMIKARHIERLQLPEFNVERAPVFSGGLAILVETMICLGIEELAVSEGALREGLLYDMLGRIQHEDARDRSIRAMQLRFHGDEAQSERVRATALELQNQVREPWRLNDESLERVLGWAAQVHEVGLDISHAKYHEHGAYLIANTDLPGFGRLEQVLLSILVGYQRRKIDSFDIGELPAGWREKAIRLTILFRLAVLLNRSRSPAELPEIRLLPSSRSLRVRFPKEWLASNYLTQADLKQERVWLKGIGFRLRIGTFAQD